MFINVLRFCLTEKLDLLELHVFCNASEKVFGAWVYTVSKLEQVALKSLLLFAKSKIKLNALNFCINKMEFLASLIGSRVILYVYSELRKSQIFYHLVKFVYLVVRFCFTVLQILRNSKKQEIFVDNKLKEI